jgi:hypothetical protein
MNKIFQTDRRKFLKGVGTAVALPFLESSVTRSAFGASAAGQPVRLGFFFIPNGVNLEHWTPKQAGFNYELPKTLQSLQHLKNDINVITGLTHDKGRANGDGAGDHARSAGVFLTAAQPLKSEGAEIRAGQSADQRAAEILGKMTRFPSIELGTEGGRPFGKCDSGYSCAYSNNISWKNETTPMSKITNPREVFERLFGDGTKREKTENAERRKRYKKSILDFVLEDSRQLNKALPTSDQRKLDEYLTAVREIELRLEKAEQDYASHQEFLRHYNQPEGVPDQYEDHVRLLGDMMILAFQTDSTRVCSFMLANAGSNRSYRTIGVREGHHSLSHHQSNQDKLEKIQLIDQHHVQLFSYILDRMKATPDGDSNLLHNSLLVFGSSISDGNRHNNENLPLVTAGHAGGRLVNGRHIMYPEETPMANLLVSMLNAAGVDDPYFGDSTGPLRNFIS